MRVFDGPIANISKLSSFFSAGERAATKS